jgi:hypothetical protein
MTNRNQWPRWIAAAVLGLALLAFFAWRTETGSLRQTAQQTTRTSGADSAQRPRSHAGQSGFKKHGSAVPTEDGPEATSCDNDFKSELQAYRAELGPARTADEALDQLLLDTLAMRPEDWMTGTPWLTFAEASKRWPNDVDLAWIGFDRCGEFCDRTAAARHLVAVDPDNTATWMVAMADARERGDENAFDKALQRAAGAKVYDPRGGIVFLHARRLLEQVPLPDSCLSPIASLAAAFGQRYDDDERKDLMADGLEAATTTFAWAGISACNPKAFPLSGTQRRQCQAVLSRVASGDSLSEQVLAVRQLLLFENDVPRQRELRERYRQLRWLMTQAMPDAGSIQSRYLVQKWSQGEVMALTKLAVDRRQWPPPADWLPNDGARYVITGEPPPN